MRVALYLRVSTNEQTTENQRIALEVVAQQRGWLIAAVYDDSGISGAKGRADRPGLDKMLQDAAAGGFDMVAAWRLDRLGRSLRNLLDTLYELDKVKVALYLHDQAVDTSTPAGRMFFQMIGAFAEFERNMIQDRIRAGIERVRQTGVTRSGKPTGKPPLPAEMKDRARGMLLEGASVRQVADSVGMSIGGVAALRAACRGERLAQMERTVGQ
jgi:DNA invertase Pin-like site-specific DNA recombinase